MAKKQKHQEEPVNEFAAEAEKNGDISHEEAVAPTKVEDTDGDVRRPQVQGHRPEDYGPPKNGSSSIQKREVIGEDTENK